MKGVLYIVPTPIGNLGDITFRSIEILKEVDQILAEDTRVTGKLLKHLEIEKPLFSNHAHNEHRTEKIIDLLNNGTTIAVVSDAGTPAISDPGHILVKACIENSIEVITLPGPTAFVPALINSGFATESFVYEGFLPHKKGRKTKIEQINESSKTTVIYESPHRIKKMLDEFFDILGPERKISLSREITKKFEETIRGTVEEIKNHYNENDPRGEYVVVIEGIQKKKIKVNKYKKD